MGPDGAFYDGAGKTVFVAGGTSGINRGIARRFAEAEAKLFVMSRSADKVEDTVSEFTALGVEAAGATADVRNAGEVEAAFAACVARFGEIDVLVSGAAGNFPARAAKLSSNGFRAVMEIDVLGTHHVMLSAYKHMRRPGAIINISAGMSERPMVGQVHVCAAKAGVDQITRTLALEWGPEGIRVNSVIPGPIEGTEGMKRLTPSPEHEARLKKTIPLVRYGAASEVGDLCLFLASDRAAYITGAVIPVDGGSTMAWPVHMLEPALAYLDQKGSE
ncbi:MAG: SDR family oxidoreductase [Pseudomonadota bacterium]